MNQLNNGDQSDEEYQLDDEDEEDYDNEENNY
jgi:hypothetical protein